QPGLQENLCACECNLIFICGAATSGKTYAMYLKSLYGMDKPGFTATLFSFREKDSQKGSSIFRDGVEVLGNFANCDYVSSGNIGFRFPQYNSQLQLANFNYNVNNPAEWSDFKEDMKKRQSSDIDIDEGTKMGEKAQLYLFSRNRDSSGMIPQMTISFNPEYEHFTCQQVLIPAGYTEPYLNGVRIKKDWEGRIRYFYLKGKTWKTAIWGDTPEEVVAAAGITISDEERKAGMDERSLCKSFTVFTGEAAGNRKLVNATGGQSVANLSASGDADALRGGVFLPRDNEEVNVDRSMILNLWENPVDNSDEWYATMDISAGKESSDNSPMVIWKGLHIREIHLYKNDEPIVDFINRHLDHHKIPITHFAYDAAGVGNLLEQCLKKGAIGITSNSKVQQEYDQFGNPAQVDAYYNLRSQLLSKTEFMLAHGEISCGVDKDALLPYGKKGMTRRLLDILFDEINLFITTDKNGKIYYRKKGEYKDKFKSSPDLMDAISYRMYFELSLKERKQPKAQVPNNAYHALYHRPKVVSGWGRYR
ncbi:MAG: hypothetical protein NC311_13700, partial [Muribaculaceae bacterium]|nr:hypothetical protein [Muribaculaceae bacterium]